MSGVGGGEAVQWGPMSGGGTMYSGVSCRGGLYNGVPCLRRLYMVSEVPCAGAGDCMVKSIALWDPLPPSVNRQTRLKTLLCRNFVGGW